MKFFDYYEVRYWWSRMLGARDYTDSELEDIYMSYELEVSDLYELDLD